MLDFIFVKENERLGALLYSRASIRNKGESVSILRYCLDIDVKYFLNTLFYILRLLKLIKNVRLQFSNNIVINMLLVLYIIKEK